MAPCKDDRFREYWKSDQDEWIDRIQKTQGTFILVASLVLTCTFGASTSFDEAEKLYPGNPTNKAHSVVLAMLLFLLTVYVPLTQAVAAGRPCGIAP